MTSCSMRGRWHPLPLLAMVLGFMIWWPLGIAALLFMACGGRLPTERMQGAFDRARSEFGGFAGGAREWRNQSWGGQHWSGTGNAAFDEYKAETLRRLDEERRRIEEEGRAFAEFMANLRRARDKEEFDRFMAERRGGNA